MQNHSFASLDTGIVAAIGFHCGCPIVKALLRAALGEFGDDPLHSTKALLGILGAGSDCRHPQSAGDGYGADKVKGEAP